jgi:hypothetical protein
MMLHPSFAQDSTDGALVSNVVYEKVYVHVDREVFASGEDIWFKIYLVSGINHQLVRGYKNVYVHLVNDSGRVVQERLLLVHNGVANGDIGLPYRIREGQYTLRAFTKYQQNFSEESYFHKKLYISRTIRPQVNTTAGDSNAIDVSFYPEGGNLVMNASNNIAFKAVNVKGRGIPVSGMIIDDLGDSITPFSTSFMGMGKFALMPEPGRTYFAALEGDFEFSYEFGEAQQHGVTLQFRDGPTAVKFGVARNFNATNRELFRLVASHKGTHLFSTMLELDSFYSEIEVSKGRFPLGISRISLMDTEGTILAERLVFIKVDEPPAVRIEASQEAYDARSSVALSFEYLDEETDSVPGGLSVAVINRDYLNRDGYDSDIRSFLLLDSELKGPVESPATYFQESPGISAAQKLDLLMMVQGWRSYYWQEILVKEPEDLQGWEDVGIDIGGYVKRLFRDNRVNDARVVLGPLPGGLSYLGANTENDGTFRFNRLFLRDSSMLVLQAETKSGGKMVEIIVEDLFVPARRADQEAIDAATLDPLVPATYFSENFSKQEAERKYAIESGTYWLEEVEIVTGERETVLNLEKEAERTYGVPQKRLEVTGEDYSYLNIYDYLEGKLPGVVVQGNSISIRGGLTPTILLDDVVNDLVDIGTIPMGDIDHIDIFYSGGQTAAFGSRGADGIIAIYTKKGSTNADFNRYVRGRTSRSIDGFQVPRQFYSPKYLLDQEFDKIPDYRPTLYWEPYVLFENGRAQVEFYTSDFRNRYIVIAEGISTKGRIITAMTEFEVE